MSAFSTFDSGKESPSLLFHRERDELYLIWQTVVL
jgi:hypothetical protein